MITSRRRAYAYMLKHNYPKEALTRMRLSLIGKERWRGKFDGWQESPLLPSGWLYRDTSSIYNTYFLNSEGQELTTRRDVREHMKNDERYSSHQLELFNKFMATKLLKKRAECHNWEESRTVPEGWRVRRTICNQERLLSPTGQEVRIMIIMIMIMMIIMIMIMLIIMIIIMMIILGRR